MIRFVQQGFSSETEKLFRRKSPVVQAEPFTSLTLFATPHAKRVKEMLRAGRFAPCPQHLFKKLGRGFAPKRNEKEIALFYKGH